MLKFSFTMGIVFIVISAIFNGAWVDGQQQRGNFFLKQMNDNSNLLWIFRNCFFINCSIHILFLKNIE